MFSQVSALLMTFVISLAAHSDEPAVGQHAKVILEGLLDKNIQQVGDLNIQSLKQEINEVNWEISDDSRGRDAIARRSARFFPQEKKVQIFTHYGAYFTNQVQVLELHEALGALGYNDQNYSLSTTLDHLNKTKDSNKREQLKQTYGEHFFQLKNLKPSVSGGSSVGGGGDLTGVILKSMILEQIDRLKNPDSDFYIKFAQINIEPAGGFQHFVNNKPRIFFAMEMSRDPQDEKITIRFPAFLGLQGTKPEQIQQIAADIAVRIIEFYPVTQNTRLVPVSIYTCEEEKTLYYPEAQSPGILYLQKLKTEFLLGCGKLREKSKITWAFNWPCL